MVSKARRWDDIIACVNKSTDQMGDWKTLEQRTTRHNIRVLERSSIDEFPCNSL